MELENQTLKRVTTRLVPFLIVCYFIAYLDRVNVGFAALTMNRDLGLSQTAYGLGAGIFFFTYFLFEVPSNLFLAKFGARRWIARIMLTWGVLSGTMAFIQGEWSFYIVRCLLGAAEAGFFPGIIFYLTLWFPAAYRARILGYFMAAIPLSSVLGLPVSGALLGMDGVAGLHGWQWLFIIEAVPALVLAVVVLYYLTDRPADATWLPAENRTWLMRRIAAEEQVRTDAEHFSVFQALINGRVLALSLVYFGVVASLYGLSFFLPQIVKQFGVSTQQNSFISAVPFVIGVVATLVWGRLSDQTGNRKGMTAVALFLVAVGIAAAALLDDPYLKMAAFCVAAFGIFGTLAVFWTLPTSFLSGMAAAGGIAVINSIGNLAGFAGPYAMGAIKDATNSYQGGLFLLAGLAAIAMLIVLALRHDRYLEMAPSFEAQALDQGRTASGFAGALATSGTVLSDTQLMARRRSVSSRSAWETNGMKSGLLYRIFIFPGETFARLEYLFPKGDAHGTARRLNSKPVHVLRSLFIWGLLFWLGLIFLLKLIQG